MAGQLTFDLDRPPQYDRASYVVTDANRIALEMIYAWRSWPNGKMVLSGPSGSGKTHLAHIWADAAGGAIVQAAVLNVDGVPDLPLVVAVEDVHAIAGHREPETALFHLHNRLREEGGYLLVTAARAPGRLALLLKDLESRLQAAPLVPLTAPDDALLEKLLEKLFRDRQITPQANLIPFLVRRIERSFDAARAVVDALDHRALEQKRAISIQLAKQVLDISD